ncbi:MAG: guanylate kinase [Planctomycetota bacterium]|jgi:guanylate kinase
MESSGAMLLVVSGPGGAGKSTLCRRLAEEGDGLELSISATSRAPREGERDGEHYFFRERGEFESEAAAGGFAEHAEVAGHLYGTPRSFLDAKLDAGVDIVLDIDVQGAEQVRAAYGPRAVLVFVLPPSRAVLEERLRGRGTDSDERVAERMALAEREIEAARVLGYDYLVVNDRLEAAADELAAIRRAEHDRVTREGSRAAWALKTWT